MTHGEITHGATPRHFKEVQRQRTVKRYRSYCRCKINITAGKLKTGMGPAVIEAALLLVVVTPILMRMGGKLLREIHKLRPFDSVQQELFLNVIRTADHLMRGFEELLKPHNLSATQYNILRV